MTRCRAAHRLQTPQLCEGCSDPDPPLCRRNAAAKPSSLRLISRDGDLLLITRAAVVLAGLGMEGGGHGGVGGVRGSAPRCHRVHSVKYNCGGEQHQKVSG